MLKFLYPSDKESGGEPKGKVMVATRPTVPCFDLARAPEELQSWILPRDIFNQHTPRKSTLCQRTVYLIVLTLRALLESTSYTVCWKISDDNGIGTHIYLINEQSGSKTELAEIVCFNDRKFVWGIRMTPNPFTGDAKEFNGREAAEGLRHLLMNVARFAHPQTKSIELPIVGSNNLDELKKLIKTSGEYRGGANFISNETIARHFRR